MDWTLVSALDDKGGDVARSEMYYNQQHTDIMTIYKSFYTFRTIVDFDR